MHKNDNSEGKSLTFCQKNAMFLHHTSQNYHP
jgi:hypothetical protein